ncbi:hypothetical protein [Sessilibacter corallicola]|uniref:Uncharacterized protein n=1 Tax=Sessilibacter corallicola TaxID=2904075 RepID=A0ABQ0ABC6_9GAMM
MLFLLLMSISSSAAFIANTSTKNMYVNSFVYFGIDNAPEDTCNYFGRHFRFDATTEAGKNMFSVLLAAEMADRKIAIWYTESSVAGTNETNGCHQGNMALVSQIGFIE